MKKILIIITLFICLLPLSVNAQRGCCSSHRGVVGCSPDGRQICGDGTLSPSCTCTPDVIKGCTDKSAKNYNSNANSDDGSCEYYKYGCTDVNSVNYDASAEKGDGSCIPIVYGCMDENAINYNSEANTSDDSCEYKKSEEVINNTEEPAKEEIVEEESDDDSGFAVGLATIACGGIGFAVYKGQKNKKKLQGK